MSIFIRSRVYRDVIYLRAEEAVNFRALRQNHSVVLAAQLSGREQHGEREARVSHAELERCTFFLLFSLCFFVERGRERPRERELEGPTCRSPNPGCGATHGCRSELTGHICLCFFSLYPPGSPASPPRYTKSLFSSFRSRNPTLHLTPTPYATSTGET